MIAQDKWDPAKVHLLQAIHFWDEAENKRFMYGWELPPSGVDASFTVLAIPQTTWVVITVPLDNDRAAISRCYNDLYVNWFPTSGYEQAPKRPVIEKYENNSAELWMPVLKKEATKV